MSRPPSESLGNLSPSSPVTAPPLYPGYFADGLEAVKYTFPGAPTENLTEKPSGVTPVREGSLGFTSLILYPFNFQYFSTAP